MDNYAKRVAITENGVALLDLPPNYQALATTARDNATVSSVTVLNSNTTTVEVAATTAPAAIRWSMATNTAASSSVITAAGTAAFDHYIPAGTVRRFVVPRNSQALPNYNANGSPSVVGRNTAEGLFSGIATKSAGVGSVLVTEF